MTSHVSTCAQCVYRCNALRSARGIRLLGFSASPGNSASRLFGFSASPGEFGFLASRLRPGIRLLGFSASRLRPGIRLLGFSASRLRPGIRLLGFSASRLPPPFRGPPLPPLCVQFFALVFFNVLSSHTCGFYRFPYLIVIQLVQIL